MHGRYLAGMASANTLTRNFLPTDGFWPERGRRSLVRDRQLLHNGHRFMRHRQQQLVKSFHVRGSTADYPGLLSLVEPLFDLHFCADAKKPGR